MENKGRPKTELDRNVPNIKIKQKKDKPKARSESARRIHHSLSSPDTNIKNNSSRSSISNIEHNQTNNQPQSPLYTPRAQPLSTRSNKSKKAQYVGFKATEVRNKADLIHNRNITEQLLVSQKPEPVLQTLNNMIKQIPTEDYETSDAANKLQIVTKLFNAFTFAWNEISLQIKELSEEHAMVLFHLKTFYNHIFSEYPKILYSFDQEVQNLKLQIQERDQQINLLTKQIDENEDSLSSIRNYISGLQNELDDTIAQRDSFESELSKEVIENDQLQSTLTDLRCTIRKQREGIIRLYKIFDMVEAQPHAMAVGFVGQSISTQSSKGQPNQVFINQSADQVSTQNSNSSLKLSNSNISDKELIEYQNEQLKRVFESEKTRNDFTKIVIENLKLDKKMDKIVNRKGNEEFEEALYGDDSDDEENNSNTKKISNVILRDVSVDTSDMQIPLNEQLPFSNPFLFERPVASKNLSLKSLDLSLIKSEEAFSLAPLEPAEVVSKDHEPLRRVILSFMKSPLDKVDSKLMPDQTTEFKKFYWIYPKYMTIFTNGLNYENPERPFKTFDDVVTSYFRNMYQTSYLANQMQQVFINSIYIFEKIESSVHLFYSFLTNEYDLNEFRFLYILLEYSLNSTDPQISTLMNKEMLTPEDTQIHIKRSKAREIYTALFPIGDVPKWLNDSINEPNIEYWDFIENCIKKFDEYRNHMWSIIKNGLLLSDCSDTSHITYKQFKNFFGIALPSVSFDEVKSIWNELTTRNKANEKRDDMLEFEALCYYITQKEELFFEVVRRVTPRNFTARYFDLNGSILNALTFIVKRLVYYIPTVYGQMKSNLALFQITGEAIRECLFMCDIPRSFSHYRMLLHLIDGVYVRDLGSLKLSSRSSDQEVKEFLEHFETREKAVGIISLSRSSSKIKSTN
ncbi:hypothetical protein M9Y10_013191 [Tritrichomonas musculus]|uniref:Translin-associated factor X-interacting protein 1 N-terminal domain-containing protein n=2 Tax=Tritrichomonas musculus TaxID=1915356 RepID=A0ABR2I786_9EUKA